MPVRRSGSIAQRNARSRVVVTTRRDHDRCCFYWGRTRTRTLDPLICTNIVAEVQSPKTRSRRCCETMICVLSSFIRLSEPTSRGTVTGQRTSRTRSRASCPTSRTSEHSSAGATGRDVRMFTTGWTTPRRRSVCRTADVLALKAHNLDATTFWSAPAPLQSDFLQHGQLHGTTHAS